MTFKALQDLLAHNIPEDNRAILAAADSEAQGRVVDHISGPICAEASRQAIFIVDMALECLEDTALDVTPHPDAAIQGPGQDVFAVGGELDTGCRRVIFHYQGAETLATVGVPDTDKSVQSTRGDEGSVKHNINTGNRVGVGWQRAHDLCSANIPHEHGLVIGTADKDVTLWCECDLIHVVMMAIKDLGVGFELRQNISKRR